MGRENRDYPLNTVVHITQKTANSEFMLSDSYFKEYYCLLLEKATKKFPVKVFNYVVMDNHIHLLLLEQNPSAISLLLNVVNTNISRAFNKVTYRTGPFWNRRSNWTPINNLNHLIEAMLYIDFNPVRTKSVEDPRKFPFSGTGGLCGRFRDPILDWEFLTSFVPIVNFDSTYYNRLISFKLQQENKSVSTARWKVDR